MLRVTYSADGIPNLFHKGLLEKLVTQESLTLGRNSVYSC
jgi:hypothetical protein